MTIDANSDLRRSCSLTLQPNDNIEITNALWLDKYIQISIGIMHDRKKEIIYNNMGIFLINNPNTVYSAVDNTIKIEGLDLFSKLTGLRDGNLEGILHIIRQNENVRKAIIETIKLGGFENYVVAENKFNVPNEIRIESGGTIYDILTQLKNILPNYEMYFDTDGVFRYEEIPIGDNEQIRIDDDLLDEVVISTSSQPDYSYVKNIIEVFGKTHDIKHYGNPTYSSNVLTMDVATLSSLWNNLKVGFTTPNNTITTLTYLKINSFTQYPIKKEDGSIPKLDPNVYYVCKFIEDEGYFQFMGEVTPWAIARDDNPDSLFSTQKIGEIRQVYQSGEYDNIYTTDLAQERANWELYHHTNLQDTITFTNIPIYWIDVNWIIEYNGIKYLTKQINTTYGATGTQTITCIRYYPFYTS